MKRLWLVLLAALMLGGCGKKDPADTTFPEPPKVGLCWYSGQDQTGAELRPQLEEKLRRTGYDLQVRDGEADQALQTQQVQELLETGVDLLIIEPVMPSAAEPLTALLDKTDVPVIFINREIRPAAGKNQCYIGFDPARAGTLQGQLVRLLEDGGDLNGDGTVSYLIIQGPEDHLAAQACTEACAQAMEPGVRNLSVVSGDWSRESGKNLCAAALSKFGRDVEVILCGSGEMTLGALAAVEENGWIPGKDLYLVGMGGSAGVLEGVRQGLLAGTVYADLGTEVARIGEAAAMLLAGQMPGSTIDLPFAKVTAENIEAFCPDE